jgi:CRISPR-associated protein Csm2
MATLKDLPKAKENYFNKDNLYDELLSMDNSKSIGKIIDEIKRFVEIEGKTITTSQLRNIYARIKKADSPEELQLLRPVLAYTSARQKGDGGKVIIALLDDLIQKIKSKEEVSSFQTFAEAIVAYHKYHHPKQS